MDENLHFWKRIARMYPIDIDRKREFQRVHIIHTFLWKEVGGVRNYRNFLRSKNNNDNCTSSGKERKQQMVYIRFFSRF